MGQQKPLTITELLTVLWFAWMPLIYLSIWALLFHITQWDFLSRNQTYFPNCLLFFSCSKLPYIFHFIWLCFVFCPSSLSHACGKISVLCAYWTPENGTEIDSNNFFSGSYCCNKYGTNSLSMLCIRIDSVRWGAKWNMRTILMPSMAMTTATVHHHLSQNANKCQAHINQPTVNDSTKKSIDRNIIYIHIICKPWNIGTVYKFIRKT